MIKKLMKVVLAFSLLLIFSHSEVGHAKTLEEEREAIIENLRMGITETFTYEEVDAYLAEEEAAILDTGATHSLSSYGIEGNHSTGQGLMVLDYLQRYFDTHTDESEYETLYPYAVDFNELPDQMTFYRDGYEVFVVENKDGTLVINENEYNAHKTHLKNIRQYNGMLQDNVTQEFAVYPSDEIARTVKVNTRLAVQESSAHRTDYIFYFFYNKSGSLSLIKWDLENPKNEYPEHFTLESFEALTGNATSKTSSNWALPYDWRILSPRRQDVPPVTWVLTSVGDGESIAIEPVFTQENVVSGFIPPSYSVEAYTQQVYSGEYSNTVTATPDSSGYFSLNLDITIGTPPTVRVLNETGQVVFENTLDVYEYRPTALAHDSGYLTLERYFIEQDYMEGFTYPHAEVTVQNLNGYAGGMIETTQADSTGHFYINVPGHMYNKTTNIVSVTHPDTGEKISVAPYPWTESELENAQW